MGASDSREESKDAEVVQVDHWIYGSVPGEGYTTKAISRGLTVGLYDQYLSGHYTPIRAANVQGEGAVNLHMVHPVGSGEELLLSRVSRGPPDEAGRPTFANHTGIVPAGLLRSGRITLEAVYRALEEFEKKSPTVTGEMSPLKVPARSESEAGVSFAVAAHRYVSLPALETLATRMMTDPRNRTLILCRDSTTDSRNKTLYAVIELLNWVCGLPPFTAISDAPTASALKFFKLVVAPRGVRSDASWALLESALSEAALPRLQGRDQVYEALAAAFRQSVGVPSVR